MIQGGDVSLGSGGESIYGGLFEDEELGEFEQPWLVAMANKGKDANGSQFFITTEPATHLNGEAVVFGHVISGFEYIKEIEKLSTNEDFYPESRVVISNCGELIRKKKLLKEESLKQDSLKQEEITVQDEDYENKVKKGSKSGFSNQDVEQELIPETKELKVEATIEEDGALSEDNELLDSDYEFPSVQVPHFNEPKSYLDRGGRDPNWKPVKAIEKDCDGRRVKGRGNLVIFFV